MVLSGLNTSTNNTDVHDVQDHTAKLQVASQLGVSQNMS